VRLSRRRKIGSRVLRHVALSIAAFVLITSAREYVRGNGGKGKKVIYAGAIEVGKDSGEVLFSSELERVMFRLTSVQNKYKVVRVKIENKSRKQLYLSREKDKMELQLVDRVITGILNISSHDPTLWDSLDPELRKALAYPQLVEPGEEENIFVFIPDRDLKEVPRKFTYTIGNVPQKKVVIYDTTPSKKL